MAKRSKPVARKQPPKRPSLDEAVALLRRRYGGRLAPPLEGLAYRFTVWLPILAQGKPVFSEKQQSLLNASFATALADFPSPTSNAIRPGPAPGFPRERVIVDYHILLIIYAL